MLANTFSDWVKPTQVEACGCIECPIDQYLGCPSDRTMFAKWPYWFIANWIPRRIWCACVGHLINKWSGPNKCDRCWSRKIMPE